MPELLNDQQIAEIAARTNAATEGWYIEDERDAVRYSFRIYDKYHQGVCKMTSGGEFHDRPHSEFIKHARADVPALIATVRHLQDENGTLKKHWADTCEDLASAWLKQGDLQTRLAQVEKERDDLRIQLKVIIPYVSGKRRQLKLLRSLEQGEK